MPTTRRGAAAEEADRSSKALLDVLGKLSPGTPLRTSIERIMQNDTGALVVLGTGPDVEGICTGGFSLQSATFSPARLAELSKMDGAVILSDDWQQILMANVQLHPDADLPTDETGARHRTAERVARQTGRPVVAVSEERRVATLYLEHNKHQLLDPTELVIEVNQSLVTLERFRRRLDESEDRLTRLELSDLVTYRAVVSVVLRAELVLRLGERITLEAVALGDEGGVIALQLDDLIQGVERLRNLVLKDYTRPITEERFQEALEALSSIPTDHLTKPERISGALKFDRPDTHVRPLGVRLLARVPRLPDRVRDAVASHFRDFQKMIAAPVAALDEIEGIGQTRALELRQHFDRLLDSMRVWGYHDDL